MKMIKDKMKDKKYSFLNYSDLLIKNITIVQW